MAPDIIVPCSQSSVLWPSVGSVANGKKVESRDVKALPLETNWLEKAKTYSISLCCCFYKKTVRYPTSKSEHNMLGTIVEQSIKNLM